MSATNPPMAAEDFDLLYRVGIPAAVSIAICVANNWVIGRRNKEEAKRSFVVGQIKEAQDLVDEILADAQLAMTGKKEDPRAEMSVNVKFKKLGNVIESLADCLDPDENTAIDNAVLKWKFTTRYLPRGERPALEPTAPQLQELHDGSLLLQTVLKSASKRCSIR